MHSGIEVPSLMLNRGVAIDFMIISDNLGHIWCLLELRDKYDDDPAVGCTFAQYSAQCALYKMFSSYCTSVGYQRKRAGERRPGSRCMKRCGVSRAELLMRTFLSAPKTLIPAA